MSDALDELRAKYFKVVPADPDAPKVFHIFTKAPYAPEPAKPKRGRKAKVDKQSVEMLEELVEDFRAGTLKGCCLISWNTAENRLEQHVILPPDQAEIEAALIFSGGAMMLNQALQDVAEFGLDAMREANDVVVMDDELEPVS